MRREHFTWPIVGGSVGVMGWYLVRYRRPIAGFIEDAFYGLVNAGLGCIPDVFGAF